MIFWLILITLIWKLPEKMFYFRQIHEGLQEGVEVVNVHDGAFDDTFPLIFNQELVEVSQIRLNRLVASITI